MAPKDDLLFRSIEWRPDVEVPCAVFIRYDDYGRISDFCQWLCREVCHKQRTVWVNVVFAGVFINPVEDPDQEKPFLCYGKGRVYELTDRATIAAFIKLLIDNDEHDAKFPQTESGLLFMTADKIFINIDKTKASVEFSRRLREVEDELEQDNDGTDVEQDDEDSDFPAEDSDGDMDIPSAMDKAIFAHDRLMKHLVHFVDNFTIDNGSTSQLMETLIPKFHRGVRRVLKSGRIRAMTIRDALQTLADRGNQNFVIVNGNAKVLHTVISRTYHALYKERVENAIMSGKKRPPFKAPIVILWSERFRKFVLPAPEHGIDARLLKQYNMGKYDCTYNFVCSLCKVKHKYWEICPVSNYGTLLGKDNSVYAPRKDLTTNLVIYADGESIIHDTGDHEVFAWGFVLVKATFREDYSRIEEGIFNIRHKFEIKHKESMYVAPSEAQLTLQFFQKMKAAVDIEIEADRGNLMVASRTEKGEEEKPAIIIYFHNGAHYDWHFLIGMIMKECTEIGGIALNLNSFKQLSAEYGDTRFIFRDSMKHKLGSLAQLYNGVKAQPSIHNIPADVEKAPYPYKLIDSRAMWQNIVDNPDYFPPYEVVQEYQSREQYDKMLDICQRYDFRGFGDYVIHYLEMDCLMLAEVMDQYRQHYITRYRLDPATFVTSPAVSANLGFNTPEFQSLVKVIVNKDWYWLIQHNIRGGVALCSKRYAPTHDDTEIIMLDINSCYSRSMTEFLPGALEVVVDFEEGKLYKYWTEEIPPDPEFRQFAPRFEAREDITILTEYQRRTFSNLNNDEWKAGNVFAMIEADIFVPETEKWTGLPPCATKDVVSSNGDTRLMSKFGLLENYFMCLENFAWCQEHAGIECRKLKKILLFNGGFPLKNYIEENIAERAVCLARGDKAGSDNYKLNNNSVYGKTMENVQKYKEYKISDVLQRTHHTNMGKASEFRVYKIDEGSSKVATLRQPTRVMLNKCPQVGFAITENAKLQILKGYNALHEMMEKFEFCYTDTDSIVAEVRAPGGVDAIQYLIDNNPEMFCNNKDLGKWASEFPPDNKPIEFCGLGAKQYCVLTENQGHKMAHKGVSKSSKVLTSNQRMMMEDFKTVLTTKQDMYVEYAKWTRVNHKVNVDENAHRVALTFQDLKRFILEDGIHTLPIGHSQIALIRETGEQPEDDPDDV